jgi:hypothetical protein
LLEEEKWEREDVRGWKENKRERPSLAARGAPLSHTQPPTLTGSGRFCLIFLARIRLTMKVLCDGWMDGWERERRRGVSGG